MTLGCGGYGGNITSDNISPKHLLNIKRLAYEVSPAVPAATRTPQPASAGISADTLAARVGAFLGQRGFAVTTSAPATVAPAQPSSPPLTFVCEDDVRLAIQKGHKLVVSERAIVTPAARELADAHKVLTIAPLRT
jgi:hypothetical protein